MTKKHFWIFRQFKDENEREKYLEHLYELDEKIHNSIVSCFCCLFLIVVFFIAIGILASIFINIFNLA